MRFVHLHTKTHFSMLDSTIRVEDLVARADADRGPSPDGPPAHDAPAEGAPEPTPGFAAVAMTDHNNMFGAIDFLKAAKKKNVRPIYGAEINLFDGDRTDGEVRKTYTLVLLCKDLVGYKNLCYLLSRGYMDAPPKSPGPRIDLNLLRERSEGLIALSAGLSGEVAQSLLRGKYDEAKAKARTYQTIFPRDHFYLEVIRNGIKEQERVNEGLIALSEELELPLVAAADAHYAAVEDAGAHEILMCVQMGKRIPTLDTRARVTDGLYMAPADEMFERFSDLPDAVANTVAIAKRCDVTIPLGEIFLPTYPMPEGFDSEEDYLRHISLEGLEKRIAQAIKQGFEVDEQVYRDRLDVELGIINQMGFPGYFLIVWDFIDHARKIKVSVGPGRGSGAGSLVAYSLGITDIDPMQYSLLFERFLNPERVSMPDFDIDFCMNKREQVIQYVTRKYGDDNVGQIITYGTMKAKAVVRDVARVLGLTFAEADRAAKLVPDELGMTLEKAFKAERRLTDLCHEDERYMRLFEVARKLEGLNRQPGMHAAGVVIGDKPLWDYVPLYAVHNDDGAVTRITQFAKEEVEEAGLVKFDFLGLKTLTVIDHALELINARHAREGKEPLDIMMIPLKDKRVFKLITAGDTTGVFQLESSGFKELLRKLKPDCFEDIIAAVALYRPGPLQSGMVDSFIKRKHGQERVTYPHPSLDKVLKETYGVMVYQEQIMQSASVLAGFSLGQADILRRAMGKKKASAMAKQRKFFVEGCAERNVDAQQASDIFDTIEKFAGYGFNKSHSAAYGLISYQTAWLKTHYPVEFMAALLTCDGDNTDKVVRLIGETRAMGITVLPPSVKASAHDFTPDDGAIRFGLGAIKGVGGGAVEAILESRAQDGPYEDLYDFCERVDLRRVNRRVMESLTKCGAFDPFNLTRKGIIEELDRAIERGQTVQRDKAAGQFDLFGALEPAGDVPKPEPVFADEWGDRDRLAFEKECLGFYVSGHPLDRYKAEIGKLGATSIANLGNFDDRSEVVVAAVFSEIRERTTKTGNRMAFIQLEDLTGRLELMVFTRAYPLFEPYLTSDEPVLVRARVAREGDGDAKTLKLRADSVRSLAEAQKERATRARVTVDAGILAEREIDRLASLLKLSREGLPVDLVLRFDGQQTGDSEAKGDATIGLGETYKLPIDDDILSQVERLVGKGRVAFV